MIGWILAALGVASMIVAIVGAVRWSRDASARGADVMVTLGVAGCIIFGYSLAALGFLGLLK